MWKWLAGAAWLLLPLAGCGPGQSTPTEQPATSRIERGPLTWSASAMPPVPQVGDPVDITLEFAGPHTLEVALPEPNALSDLEVREAGDLELRELPEERRIWRRTLKVDTLLSGELVIPPLVARYRRDAASEFNEMATDSIRLNVRGALTSQDSVRNPRDITALRTWPAEPLSPWTIAAAILGVLAAGGLMAWLVARLVRWVTRPAPPLPAEVVALRALERLGAAELLGRGRAREFYYTLTDVVRRYLEDKFGLRAPERTTDEFLGELAACGSADPHVRGLRDLLESSDLVKFAGAQPSREQAAAALETAVELVRGSAAARRFAGASAVDAPPAPVRLEGAAA